MLYRHKNERHYVWTYAGRKEKWTYLRTEGAVSGLVLLVKEAGGFITSACKKLSVPRFTIHALRHLFGNACLEAGVDVRTVAGGLGHKDNGALRLKVYSHVRQEHEAEMIRKVRFAPVDPSP